MLAIILRSTMFQDNKTISTVYSLPIMSQNYRQQDKTVYVYEINYSQQYSLDNGRKV